MLIFGWGFKTIKRYGSISQGVCNTCNNHTKWELVRITTWFTLFFIPVIPTNFRRMIICKRCNAGREIDKETFEKLRQSIMAKDEVETAETAESTETTETHHLADELKYVNKTETQKNYLKEMAGIRREKEEKEKEKNKILKEDNIIKQSEKPYTKEILIQQFKDIGLKRGMTVIVHSSLSSIGWVSGGPITVIQALMELITREGTLIMPTHSGDYSDPTNWQNPPVPKEWIDEIKMTMPAFDPNITPTRGMGRIPEIFRKFPDVKRSYHPQVSFVAWGKEAQYITDNHSLAYSLGEDSPLSKIYDLNGFVLLLGADFDNNTSFHLSEYRITKRKEDKSGAPIFQEGIRKWVEFNDIELDSDDFNAIGKAFEKQHQVQVGKIGLSTSKLFPQKEAVDFAKEWMEKNR